MKKLCEKYDAYYETETGEWLESTCNEPECEFCEHRPATHLETCTCKVEKKPLTDT